MDRRARRALVGAGLAGLATAFVVWRRAGEAEPAPGDRVIALNAQLAQVPGRYRLLVGDSHAERLYLPALCGGPVINAGIAGARAAGVRRLAEALVLPRPPEAVIVMVGTNDLARKRAPGKPASRDAFRAEVRTLLEGLRARGGAVLAVPPPPLDGARPGPAAAFEAGERDRYAGIIAEECARAGCRLADVLPADPTRSPDGVHAATVDLVGEAGVAARLERAACQP